MALYEWAKKGVRVEVETGHVEGRAEGQQERVAGYIVMDDASNNKIT